MSVIKCNHLNLLMVELKLIQEICLNAAPPLAAKETVSLHPFLPATTRLFYKLR